MTTTAITTAVDALIASHSETGKAIAAAIASAQRTRPAEVTGAVTSPPAGSAQPLTGLRYVADD